MVYTPSNQATQRVNKFFFYYSVVTATNFNKFYHLSCGWWAVPLWHPDSKFQSIRVGRKPILILTAVTKKLQKNWNWEWNTDFFMSCFFVCRVLWHMYTFQWQYTLLSLENILLIFNTHILFLLVSIHFVPFTIHTYSYFDFQFPH